MLNKKTDKTTAENRSGVAEHMEVFSEHLDWCLVRGR